MTLANLIKLHQSKPQNVWTNYLWTEETKVEVFDLNIQHQVWWKPNAVPEQCIINFLFWLICPVPDWISAEGAAVCKSSDCASSNGKHLVNIANIFTGKLFHHLARTLGWSQGLAHFLNHNWKYISLPNTHKWIWPAKEFHKAVYESLCLFNPTCSHIHHFV